MIFLILAVLTRASGEHAANKILNDRTLLAFLVIEVAYKYGGGIIGALKTANVYRLYTVSAD